jgi:hypothetical protein
MYYLFDFLRLRRKNIMQKYFMILILLALAWRSNGQFSDDFADGDFTQNPLWEGDTGKFEINTAGQLHLSASGADTSVLVTASSRVDRTEWSFWVKLSFNTSANNFARVYLVSDNANLAGPVNGYFLQIGGSNDSIAFFRQTAGQTERLFQGVFSCTNHSTNVYRLKMIHDSTGRWTLYSDKTGDVNYQEEGHCINTGLSFSSRFGVYCHYTTSNSTKFYFDDFYAGIIRIDTLPPSADSLSLADSTTLVVTFSENVDAAAAGDIHHYFSKMNGTPIGATPDPGQGNKIRLTFQQPFPDGFADTLVVSGIPDLAGNVMGETEIPFSSYRVKARDIIMDEIMADPDPPTKLPECEYVELYNRTRFPVNLNGWTFDYGSSTKTFPGISIAPYGYLILTKGIMLNFYGPCVDLFSSYSTLSNEGTTLVLKNASGKVIHSVSYSPGWYQDPLKADGGWSLEMIDTENPCACLDNWKASVDAKGGTPGSFNSVHASNPDQVQPYLKQAEVISDTSVEILFSEAMDSLSFNDSNQWFLDENELPPWKVSAVPPAYSSAVLFLPDPLEKKHIYAVACRHPPSDCAGNLLDTLRPVRIGLPDSVLPGDLIINEILANPASDGEKFIEIFNSSEKILDLKELALGLFDSLGNVATDLKPISENSFISFPGDFSVLTKDRGDIMKRYNCPNPDAFVQMDAIPSYNSDRGTVVLARINDGIIIDRVSYSPVMYSDLLTTTDGISLERLNPMLSSGDVSSWHSASENCGYATPGYMNSNYIQANPGSDVVTLTPPVFTPDDDGNDDVLWIGYKFNDAGYSASVSIFNAGGNRVKCLARNRQLSAEDGMVWDGRDENNRKSPIGIYILYIELIKQEGKAVKMKKTIVLGGKR